MTKDRPGGYNTRSKALKHKLSKGLDVDTSSEVADNNMGAMGRSGQAHRTSEQSRQHREEGGPPGGIGRYRTGVNMPQLEGHKPAIKDTKGPDQVDPVADKDIASPEPGMVRVKGTVVRKSAS